MKIRETRVPIHDLRGSDGTYFGVELGILILEKCDSRRLLVDWHSSVLAGFFFVFYQLKKSS